MPPTELKDFFVATTGASASFIGLLFVAVSFVLNDTHESTTERMTKRILAESSYAALINIFFISLVALIPDTNLGYVILSMACAGTGATLHFFRTGPRIRHNKAILSLAAVLYVLEGAYGIYLIAQPEAYVLNRYVLMALLLSLFSVSLTRAWELMGIRNDK